MTIIDTDLDALSDREDELTEIARAAIWGMWAERARRRGHFERMHDYALGKRGVPEVAEGSSREVKTLAQQSVINVCGLVVDTFARGLSVVGFRSPSAAADDAAWQWWQEQRLDARQNEAHEAALEGGVSFVSVLPQLPGTDAPSPDAAIWAGRDVVARFENRRSFFPTEALLVSRGRDGWSVLHVTDTTVRSGLLGNAKKGQKDALDGAGAVTWVTEPWPHGATYGGQPVCPVVPFLNSRTAAGEPPRGEVEPLITTQLALNSVNFDRLCASRFAAFQQKVVIGWSAPRDQVIKASNSRVWSFEDAPGDVDVKSLPASPIAPYNELIQEMKEQVALTAAIPLYQATGSIANVSTDTAAMVESAYQRKLQMKRDSFGESWEAVLRLAATIAGSEEPAVDAEVVWRETQARAFGAVVDGMTKLAQQGIPIENLLDLIPGMTQQRIQAIQDGMRRQRAADTLAIIQAAQTTAPQQTAADADEG